MRRMRKYFIGCLCVILMGVVSILSACGTNNPPEEPILDASNYAYLTFTYDEENMTAAVIGEKSSGLLKGAIEIPDKVSYENSTYTVTEIGDSAFYDCDEIESIILPNSIEIISSNAFAECDNLEFNKDGNGLYLGNEINPYLALCDTENKLEIIEFVVNENCKFIMDCVFMGCYNIETFEMPESLISVGQYAFSGVADSAFNFLNSYKYLGSKTNPYMVLVGASDKANTNLAIHGNCKVIVEGAFVNRFDLRGILTIPNSIERIENNTFVGTGFTELHIGSKVKYIGKFAFASANWEGEISIPNSVVKLDNFAFNSCQYVTNITIGDGLKLIPVAAFLGCEKLTSVTIGKNVEEIKSSSFENCNALKNIKLMSTKPANLGTDAFARISTTLTIQVPEKSLTEYQTHSEWGKYNLIGF